MSRPKILVVGSLNIDMILEIERMQKWGKFVCRKIFHASRGKGNNQVWLVLAWEHW